MLEIVKPGLETSIQDFPGRIGYWNQGFPPSGPMDMWSFRLANLVVGNDEGAPGLEAQFMGPTIRFERPGVIAMTGANMRPIIDGQPVPMWESIAVEAGQTLVMGPALAGARGYLAVAGGIDAPQWLGSASTFHKAGVGGLDGHAVRAGQVLPVKQADGTPGRRVAERARPAFPGGKTWEVEAVRGPNDDWIDDAGHERFTETAWLLEARSDRTGYRLRGPDWTFTEKATDKLPEHGDFPSNIIDQGYPLGAVNLGGQTPIILMNDGPSMGGFICPYTVPSAAFWKLGQMKPNESIKFREVSVGEAQELRFALDRGLHARQHRIEGGQFMAEEVLTQAPGNVWKVLVNEGDSVKAGDTLFILEVMKTEVPHDAESDGVVKKLHVKEEDAVDVGQLAVEIG